MTTFTLLCIISLFVLGLAQNVSRGRSAKCFFPKRLTVDVTLSGLGNRLLALTSAAFMAYGMNRVLELRWVCRYDLLFILFLN